MLGRSRRSWKLAKRLPPAAMETLREFWQARRLDAFFFYNPTETEPRYSYDPTGVATAGRYAVRFNSPWSQTAGRGAD